MAWMFRRNVSQRLSRWACRALPRSKRIAAIRRRWRRRCGATLPRAPTSCSIWSPFPTPRPPPLSLAAPRLFLPSVICSSFFVFLSFASFSFVFVFSSDWTRGPSFTFPCRSTSRGPCSPPTCAALPSACTSAQVPICFRVLFFFSVAFRGVCGPGLGDAGAAGPSSAPCRSVCAPAGNYIGILRCGGLIFPSACCTRPQRGRRWSASRRWRGWRGWAIASCTSGAFAIQSSFTQSFTALWGSRRPTRPFSAELVSKSRQAIIRLTLHICFLFPGEERMGFERVFC